MVLNDSDDAVDLFILHPWNPRHLKIYPRNFLLYTGPPDRRALGLCMPCQPFCWLCLSSCVSWQWLWSTNTFLSDMKNSASKKVKLPKRTAMSWITAGKFWIFHHKLIYSS